MENSEFKNWMKFQMSNAGHWISDEIHNKKDDSLFYVPSPEDSTSGIFVLIDANTVRCGKYEGAIPHIGEADFHTTVEKKTDDPWKLAVEKLGLSFLLSITHGVSI